jgi:uncharacterized protein YggE
MLSITSVPTPAAAVRTKKLQNAINAKTVRNYARGLITEAVKNRDIQVSAVRTNPSKQTANNHERNIIFD